MGFIIMDRFKKLMLGIGYTFMLMSCVKDRDFDPPENNCVSDLTVNTTYAEVKDLYVDETIQIQQDLIIAGYVISSDQAGNFFNILYFQDNPSGPVEGLQLEVDLRDSHLFFPVGSKIYIKLKGLYLGKSRDVFKIGGTFTSFGNISVGRLPANAIDKHLFISCQEKVELQPLWTSIENLQPSLTNTLVQLEDLELESSELGKTFAVEREETERILIDCDGNEIVMLNSGYSDFQSEILPEGNGSLIGVLLREKEEFKLAIRDLDDLDFRQDRCENYNLGETSNQLLISELADPDNNSNARFVELYNAGSTAIDLDGWTFRRYTNDNLEISSSIDLSGHSLGANNTFIISPNAAEFESVYGFPPDLGVGKNSPADSNGDDNLELVDPFGTVVDVFGVIGEDGTDTEHEFEDGRAVRNIEVVKANPVYDFSEWSIFNDSGGNGTVNLPQNAPEDFTPGIRE